MSRQTPEILLVGDYWHSDFRKLLAHPACATTLVPNTQLSDEHLTDSRFDLIILAAARRDQFPHQWVESLRCKLAPTPLVALLGSWCEGEQRSGEPWSGVQRVYWHQWQGRIDFFLKQFASDQICDWQLPATANHADGLINADLKTMFTAPPQPIVIGVSAVSDMHYQMVADALRAFSLKPYWIERQQRYDPTTQQPSIVVVDGDSWSQDLQARIDRLRNDLNIDCPLVQLLNFPRPSDLPAIHAAGITEVVSKPFQLSDLALAIERAMENLVSETDSTLANY